MEWFTDLFTMQFLTALLSIVVIDLVLAGDNAIVIALAARNLPPHLQKKPSSGAPSVPWSCVRR
jgi:predicted tellurium resistance membrane protein TerC